MLNKYKKTLALVGLLVFISGQATGSYKETASGKEAVILSISQIQQTPDGQPGPSPYEGQQVQFNGVVTARNSNGYNVQDGTGPWNGIYVQQFFNSAAVGDYVTITGTVFEFDNETVIQAPSYVMVSQGNELPGPGGITTGEMTEAFEGVLVKISNAECVAVDGMNWTINDGSGDLKVGSRFFGFTPQAGATYTITGIGSQNNDGYILYPRWADDLGEPEEIDHDLEVIDFSGPASVTINEIAEYSLTIKNSGTQTASDYMIHLLLNGSQVSSAPAQEILPGQEMTFDLQWQPEFTGTFEIAAKVTYEEDEDPSNNMSDILIVTVLIADGSQVIVIGDEPNSDFSRLPVRLDQKYSMSQQIFYQHELNASGPIAKIGYDTNFEKEQVIYEPMQIWMKETSVMDLATGWETMEGFQLVFDGIIAYPPGQGSVVIELDIPFDYSGENNLIITSFTAVDYEHGHYWCNYYFSQDQQNTARSRWAGSNSIFNPENPPAGESINHYANTTFYVWTQETGELTGIIKGEDNQPLPNVSVTLGEDFFTTTTDDQGQYYFPFAFAGQEVISAQLFEYYDAFENISITAGEQNNHDIVMALLPRIQVSGHLVANYDNSVVIPGAELSLEGYSSFQAISDENGYFSFPMVYGDRSYQLTATAADFEANQLWVETPSNNYDLGNIIMDETPYPAGNIIAEELPTGEMNVQWNIPGEGYPEYEIAYDSNYPTDAFYWADLGGECAVRFTPFGYPAQVSGGAVNIWDGSWPPEVELLPFDIVVYAADGLSDSPNIPDEFPGTELGRLTVKPDAFGWVTFDFTDMDIIVEEGDFYISFIQTSEFPHAPPIAIDGRNPVYRNYILYPGDTYWWGYTPFYNDFMIRALVTGPGSNEFIQTKMLEPLAHDINPATEPVITGENVVYDPDLAGLEPHYSSLNMARLVETYDLYRLQAGQETQPHTWTTMIEQTADTSWVDHSWAELPDGAYRYAVKATYYGGVISKAIFTERLEKGLVTDITIMVSLSSGLDPQGTHIELVSMEDDMKYETEFEDNEPLVLQGVYKGMYQLRVYLPDHEFIVIDNLEIDDQEEINIELQEILYQIKDLEGVSLGGDVILSWQWTGAESILLIDDDNSINHPEFHDTQEFYFQLFEDAGISFDFVEITEDIGGGPDLETLMQYELVIWETGENWLDGRTLTPTEEETLALYLDRGGKLILSAQDYLFDRYHERNNLFPGEFPYDYLGVWGAAQDNIVVGDGEGAIPNATIIGGSGTSVEGLSVDFENIFTNSFIDVLLPNQYGKQYSYIQGRPVATITKNTIFTTAALPGIIDGEHEAAEFFKSTLNGFFVPTPASQTFQGFSVYRDGELIAENIMDTEFNDTGLLNGAYNYEVMAQFGGGSSVVLSLYVEVENSTVGTDEHGMDYGLYVNTYPNPFKTSITISAIIPEQDQVLLEITDIKGQHIITLVDATLEPGKHHFYWNGNNKNGKAVAKGIYFYNLKTAEGTVAGRIIKH